MKIRKIVGLIIVILGVIFFVNGCVLQEHGGKVDVISDFEKLFATFIIVSVGGGILGSEDKHEKSYKNDNSYYWNIENSIFKECWNGENYVFNWKIWFDRCDEIIHTAPDNILKDIDNTFCCYGRNQIMYLNAILSQYNQKPDYVAKKMKTLDPVIVNLSAMFSFKNGVHNGSACPDDIRIYKEGLCKTFLYNNKTVSSNKIYELTKLGQKIIDEN